MTKAREKPEWQKAGQPYTNYRTQTKDKLPKKNWVQHQGPNIEGKIIQKTERSPLITMDQNTGMYVFIFLYKDGNSKILMKIKEKTENMYNKSLKKQHKWIKLHNTITINKVHYKCFEKYAKKTARLQKCISKYDRQI